MGFTSESFSFYLGPVYSYEMKLACHLSRDVFSAHRGSFIDRDSAPSSRQQTSRTNEHEGYYSQVIVAQPGSRVSLHA